MGKALLAPRAPTRKSNVLDFQAAHFWARVNVGTESACWPSKLVPTKNGYPGYFKRNPQTGKLRKVRANREAFRIAYGYLPKRVLHRCNSKVCCNPAHLYDGTQLQNSADAKAAGQLTGRRLNPTKARAIVLLANRGVRQLDIGAQFTVSVQCVANVVNGRTWADATADLRAKKPTEKTRARRSAESQHAGAAA